MRALTLLTIGLFATGCQPFKSAFDKPASVTQSSTGPDNALSVCVGQCGMQASKVALLNSAYVSVKVCVPGTNQCQTIPNVLISSASVGLRLFSSQVSLNLPAVAGQSGQLAECVPNFSQIGITVYSLWGPMVSADVVLGNEPAVNVPVQLIRSNFAPAPTACANPADTPANLGFNGVLGLGDGPYDCGTLCNFIPENGSYYSCANGGCQLKSETVPLAKQMVNPVAKLPLDNNGVILALAKPSKVDGDVKVGGTLTLGVGTRDNNNPAGLTSYSTETLAILSGGQTYAAGVFFDLNCDILSNASPACTGANAVFFCPTTAQTFSGTMGQYTSGSGTGPVNFTMGNGDQILSASNANFVSTQLACPTQAAYVLIGMPSLLGRTSVLGYTGNSSPLGAHAYFAF